MSRGLRRRTPLIVVGLALSSRMSVAAPTTMGIEWEMNEKDISVVGFQDDTTDDSSPDAKRILCTKATVTARGKTHPLLAVTYDNGGQERVFEMVAGPLPYDRPEEWEPVGAAVNQFFDAVSSVCLQAPCRVSAQTVLLHLTGWNDCGTSRDLQFLASKRPAEMSFPDADPQVNLAVDLTSILSDTVPYIDGRQDQGDKTDAKALRAHVRQRILHREGKLQPNARAFLAWYFIALNLHFLGQQRYLLGDKAWAVKNLFEVFLKAPLNQLYGALGLQEQREVSTFLTQLSGSDDVIKNVDDEPSGEDSFVEIQDDAPPKKTPEPPVEDPGTPSAGRRRVAERGGESQ